MPYTINRDGSELRFSGKPGISDILMGCQEACIRAYTLRTHRCRILGLNPAKEGYLQPDFERDTGSWMHPQDLTRSYRTADGLYTTVHSTRCMPYSLIYIPGLLVNISSNSLAISAEYNHLTPLITRNIFNISPEYFAWTTNVSTNRVLTNAYRNIPRMSTGTATMLNIPLYGEQSKPKKPPYDASKVLTSIFGEKIANIILKEIKL